MKRFWIGISILAVLLVSGWLSQKGMVAVHRPIADDLEQAAQAALEEDWETALPLAAHAHARWKKYHHFTAAFADHNPMDDLDGLFAELEIFGYEREMPHFAAVCLHLHQLADSMAESHGINWWNLL